MLPSFYLPGGFVPSPPVFPEAQRLRENFWEGVFYQEDAAIPDRLEVLELYSGLDLYLDRSEFGPGMFTVREEAGVRSYVFSFTEGVAPFRRLPPGNHIFRIVVAHPQWKTFPLLVRIPELRRPASLRPY